METLAKWESGARTVNIREIISKDYFLANVENRVPGKPVVRKCILMKANYSKDGSCKLDAVLDLYPNYG